VELGAAGAGARQAPGSPGLDSAVRWELDSGMHRWEPGSGSQAGQRAGPSSEAGYNICSQLQKNAAT